MNALQYSKIFFCIQSSYCPKRAKSEMIVQTGFASTSFLCTWLLFCFAMSVLLRICMNKPPLPAGVYRQSGWRLLPLPLPCPPQHPLKHRNVSMISLVLTMQYMHSSLQDLIHENSSWESSKKQCQVSKSC